MCPDLQQNPPDKPKVMLKVFAQSAGAVEPLASTFQFTSAQARADANMIRDTLSQLIQAAKAAASVTVASEASGTRPPANGVSGPQRSEVEPWYNDEKLKHDAELQQSLLKANTDLFKTFMESIRTKPESISNAQFTAQFWASRIPMLRSHAIERAQSKGAYNVLSSLKTRTEDNVFKLNVTREQINLIFSQHPLVKVVYDREVPKLSEEKFWSRFFQSRLLKKLKGEKIKSDDSQDAVLDKYLDYDVDSKLRERLSTTSVPHIIDLAGNEVNHSQRKGNAPDLLMKPTGMDKMPIIRTLNSLSENIMANVTPSDLDPSAPIGMDEETFNSLALRDLQGDVEENRMILNVKDQARFFSSGKVEAFGPQSQIYAKQDPRAVVRELRSSISQSVHLDMKEAIGIDNDSSDSETERGKASTHVGSKQSFRKASAQIFGLIAEQRAQNEDLATTNTSSAHTAATCNLSPMVFERLSLTHATTTEFLHHFWMAFLSGDASRAEEIKRLAESLSRAMDRINAVAEDAEAERMEQVEKLRQSLRDYYQRTNRKRAFDPDSIKGGSKGVNQLMAPTIKAIEAAQGKYAEALALAVEG